MIDDQFIINTKLNQMNLQTKCCKKPLMAHNSNNLNSQKKIRCGMPFLIFCLFFTSISIFAQQESVVTGTVKGTNGVPLPGANVLEKGTMNGVSTDFDGNFKISLQTDNATLVISYIGFSTKEIPVKGQSNLNISLEESAAGLDEVVIIGYGAVKKSDLTGSVSSVSSKELNAFPLSNPVEALQGRAAGVVVSKISGEPGNNTTVRIRGTNSILGNNEPLYVIDGMPSSTNNINNFAIESIEILKDASATAIYGSRGANGVVLITTKRGKSGKSTVTYEGSTTMQSVGKTYDLMNPEEYTLFYNQQSINDNGVPYSTLDPNNPGAGFDWQNYLFQNAPIHNHSISISTGTEKTKVFINGNAFIQDGIVKNTGYEKFSFQTNINHEISNVFDIYIGASLNRIKKENQNLETAIGNNLLGTLSTTPPGLQPIQEDGSYTNVAGAYGFGANTLRNAVALLNEVSDENISNLTYLNGALTIKPFQGFSLRISGSYQNIDNRNDYYITSEVPDLGNEAVIRTGSDVTIINENIANYSTTINEVHNLTLTAGITQQQNVFRGASVSGFDFINDFPETNSLGSAGSFGVPSSSYTKWYLLSYLGRINYSFKNRYLLTLSYRADGSSRYSEGSKWGYFPSGAFAWRVSEENFLKDNAVISNLKLRIGYGETGSTAIAPYQTQSILSPSNVVQGSQLVTSYAPPFTYPGDLKWETTKQFNIGLDLGFLDQQLRFVFDAYTKKTSDLLNSVQLPISQGYTNTVQNIGDIQNRGVEGAIEWDVFRKEKFNWTISANMSINRNKVLSLYDGKDIVGRNNSFNPPNDYLNILREGYPLGMFYAYTYTGLDDNGMLTYLDKDENGSLNSLDKDFIGNPNPDFTYGFNSNLTYGNFDFSVFIQGSKGNDIIKLYEIPIGYESARGKNHLQKFLDYWTPQNTDAQYPKPSGNQNVLYSDALIEDGSYLRFKNIQVGYNIPTEKLTNYAIKSAYLYLSGQNLITITNYTGLDPEVNQAASGNSFNLGWDNFSYPQSQNITLGIKLEF